MKKLLFLSALLLANNIALGASWQSRMPGLTDAQKDKLKEVHTKVMQATNYSEANEVMNDYLNVPNKDGSSSAISYITQNPNADNESKRLAKDILKRAKKLRNLEFFGVIQRVYENTKNAQSKEEFKNAMMAEHYNPDDFWGTFNWYKGKNADQVKQWLNDIIKRYNQAN